MIVLTQGKVWKWNLFKHAQNRVAAQDSGFTSSSKHAFKASMAANAKMQHPGCYNKTSIAHRKLLTEHI